MKWETKKQERTSRPEQLVELAPQAYIPADNSGWLRRGPILHPTDYKESSRQAFDLACRIARDQGSRLIVLHVPEPVHISSLGMAPAPPLPRGYRGAWESRLRLLRPRDPSVRVEYRLEEGDVAAAILRVAREEHSGLIVMRGHERAWPGRLLGGSVTEEVAGKAACPVLRLHAQRVGSADRAIGNDTRVSDVV